MLSWREIKDFVMSGGDFDFESYNVSGQNPCKKYSTWASRKRRRKISRESRRRNR